MRKTLFTQAVLIICLFSTSVISSSAQSGTDKDTSLIAGQVKFLGKDSVKFYLTDNYSLAPASCATYYMIAKVNRYFQLEGPVKYYYTSNNSIAGKGSYHDGNLYGLYYSFYPDGDIKSEGVYFDNLRAGEWEYFYDKGKMKKVINFSKEGPLLEEFYNEDGKQMVKDGNGKFESNDTGSHSYSSGNIRDGLMDGRWTLRYFFNYKPHELGSIEFYSKGKFMKGISNSVASNGKEYTTNPLCTFIDKDTFLRMDYYTESDLNCENKDMPFNSFSRRNELFPDFIKDLTTELKDYEQMDTGWACVKFYISNDNRIKDINIYSALNDTTLLKKIKDIMTELPQKDTDFDPHTMIKGMDQINFFYVLIENKHFVIPEYVIYKARLRQIGFLNNNKALTH
ncbi:MAG: hypothetical protein EPN39_14700 [Chitinophagaceae bacterium]|nr:MAG: hypothetical protein EPN39_14700 [Chitinophagaceae bacterium]